MSLEQRVEKLEEDMVNVQNDVTDAVQALGGTNDRITTLQSNMQAQIDSLKDQLKKCCEGNS